jgi:hypothetical protein
MITEAEVTQEFMAEFDQLLKKYDATISCKDHYSGWAGCGSDIRMEITIPTLYNKNGQIIKSGADIELGQYYNPE